MDRVILLTIFRKLENRIGWLKYEKGCDSVAEPESGLLEGWQRVDGGISRVADKGGIWVYPNALPLTNLAPPTFKTFGDRANRIKLPLT